MWARCWRSTRCRATRAAYQLDGDAIAVARTEGITSAGIFPGGGIIGGEVPLMNLDGWT